MKVVIIGSGGREHALCYSLKNSDKVSKLLECRITRALLFIFRSISKKRD